MFYVVYNFYCKKDVLLLVSWVEVMFLEFLCETPFHLNATKTEIAIPMVQLFRVINYWSIDTFRRLQQLLEVT